MKRYYGISSHEEDQFIIPALFHALSQLDPLVEVFHLTDTSSPRSKIKHMTESRVDEK